MTSGFEDENDDQSENDKQKQEYATPPPSILLVSKQWQKRDVGLMVRIV